jgi:hypothetical protein
MIKKKMGNRRTGERNKTKKRKRKNEKKKEIRREKKMKGIITLIDTIIETRCRLFMIM